MEADVLQFRPFHQTREGQTGSPGFLRRKVAAPEDPSVIVAALAKRQAHMSLGRTRAALLKR